MKNRIKYFVIVIILAMTETIALQGAVRPEAFNVLRLNVGEGALLTVVEVSMGWFQGVLIVLPLEYQFAFFRYLSIDLSFAPVLLGGILPACCYFSAGAGIFPFGTGPDGWYVGGSFGSYAAAPDGGSSPFYKAMAGYQIVTDYHLVVDLGTGVSVWGYIKNAYSSERGYSVLPFICCSVGFSF